jgi:SM-20-related protein
MQVKFEELIDSFLENRVGISNEFLSLMLSMQLKAHLVGLYDNDKMKTAGIGNNIGLKNDKLVRNDKIFWLDRKHDNKFENQFLDIIDAFVLYLNKTCYTGISGYEFHYAMYEIGSFYKTHLDQFKNNSSRQYSMIFYLNEEWKIADGGELCIHHKNSLENISPNNRKSIFFKSSELVHEVLITNKLRMSITGWLKKD